MKRIGIILVIGLFLGTMFIGIPNDSKATTDENDPSATGDTYNQWANPANAYDGVDDTYATEWPFYPQMETAHPGVSARDLLQEQEYDQCVLVL